MMTAHRLPWLNAWSVVLLTLLFPLGRNAVAQGVITGVFETPVPGPRGDATVAKPMVWTFTQPKAGGGVESKTVNVTNLPRRAFANETAAQAADRKADTLVTEFNNVLGAGRAEKVIVAGKPNVKIFGLASGKANGQPIVAVKLGADPTLQAGNGGKFRQGSGGKLSMGAIMGIDDGARVATGIGPDGEPSVLQFGVEGVFVASLNPSPGATALSLLSQLSSQLSTNGIVNSLNVAEPSVTLSPLYDSDVYSIYWTSSDPGLPFGVGVFAVPEPASWLLVTTGAIAVGLRNWRRRVAA